MTDGLSTLYQDLLGGSYDCVDRIVLNAYFRMGHSPGGFRVWWRALTGSDDTLETPGSRPAPSAIPRAPAGARARPREAGREVCPFAAVPRSGAFDAEG